MKLIIALSILISTQVLNAQKEQLLFEYAKGACFGKCPVYQVKITQEGLLTYEGKINVDQPGIFQRQMESKELRKLKRKLKCTGFKKLDDTYGEEIMDAPATTLTYYTKDSTYVTIIKGEKPKKIEKLEPFLQSLWDLDNMKYNWEAVSLSQEKKSPRLASQMIIVQLNNNVEPETWLAKYEKYKLVIEKQLTQGKPIYLLDFDFHRISTPQLIIQMQQDPDVKSVEPNTMVKLR